MRASIRCRSNSSATFPARLRPTMGSPSSLCLETRTITGRWSSDCRRLLMQAAGRRTPCSTILSARTIVGRHLRARSGPFATMTSNWYRNRPRKTRTMRWTWTRLTTRIQLGAIGTLMKTCSILTSRCKSCLNQTTAGYPSRTHRRRRACPLSR